MPRSVTSERHTALAIAACLIIGGAKPIASTVPAAAAKPADPPERLAGRARRHVRPDSPAEDWEFAGLRALPTAWAPSWFGNGNTQTGHSWRRPMSPWARTA